jgi:integrase
MLLGSTRGSALSRPTPNGREATMAGIRGTVFERANGTFTVLAEPTWDPKRNRYRRPSLGTYKTRQEAERTRLDYSANEADGVFSLPEVEQRQIRLDSYLEEWLDLVERERLVGNITLRTQRDYETVVRCHIVPYLGRRRIGELTTSMLHRWLLDLKATSVGDRTVQKAHRMLHRALADSDLKENPAKLPKKWRPQVKDRKNAVYPTVEQVNTFTAHVEGCAEPYGSRHAVMWRLAATTGVRRGEAVGLAWPDVDFDAGTISINQTIQIDRGALYVKGPKSENGYRTIGLDSDMVRRLRRHRTQMLEQRAAAGADYEVEPLGHDFVFRADETGRPLNPDLITQAFTREWTHAGLPPGPSLHGLRHTNGSLLLLNGVPPIHVAAHLGHDLQTLNKVYAHELDPANRQEVIAHATTRIYQSNTNDLHIGSRS